MKKEQNLKEKILIIPLIMVILILPFIIRMKPIELNGAMYDYWIGDYTHNDFFSYYKKIFLYVITAISCLAFFIATPKIKKNIKIYIMIGLFGGLTILSAALSPYPEIVYGGFVDKYEGLWVILTYLFLLVYSMNVINSEHQYKLIKYIYVFSGMFISFLAIIQYFGIDFYSFPFIRAIIVPNEFAEYRDILEFDFGKGFAFSVFYNPNYLGGYLSFYVPFVFGYLIYTKDIKEKIICAIAGTLGIAGIFASKSEAGLMGALIGLFFLMSVFLLKNNKFSIKSILNSKKAIYAILPLIVIIIGVSLNLESVGRIFTEGSKIITSSKEDTTNLKEIGPLNNLEKLSKNQAVFVIDNKEFIVELLEDNLYIKDDNKKLLYEANLQNESDSVFDSSISKIEVSNYIAADGQSIYFPIKFTIEKYEMPLYFLAYQNEIFITDYKYAEITPALSKQLGFYGLERIGSARGYIWSRTLPLLSENILLGSGPGTFITRFPQNDIYAKQFAYQPKLLWIQIDKPHNLYLEIAIQSGLVALVIFILGVFYIFFFKEKRTTSGGGINRYDEYIIKAGLLGFLVSSMFNDSTLGVTPIIIIFTGVLLSFKMLDTY